MKKLITILLCLLTATALFSQFPNKQFLANNQTMLEIRGGGMADSGLAIGNFTDTVAANKGSYIKGTPYIRITVGGNSTYMRNSTANAWLPMDGPVNFIPINHLLAATDVNSIDLTNFTQTWQWTTLQNGSGLNLVVNSPFLGNAAAALSTEMSGNKNSVTTYGMTSSNNVTGSFTVNVAGLFHSSGGAANHALQIQDGSEGAGKLLSSDADGLTTWIASSAIGITANVTPILSGTDTRVLFDDGGKVGENAGFTFAKSTGSVTLGGALFVPNSTSTLSSIYLNNVKYFSNFGSANFTDVYSGPNAGPTVSNSVSQNNVGMGNGVLNAWNPTGVGTNEQVVAIGFHAMGNAIGGSNSVAIGTLALQNQHQSISSNIAIGKFSLFSDTTGGSNVAVGANTDITSGQFNTFLGHEVSQAGTSAAANTALGYRSMNALTIGAGNTGAGQRSLENLTTGIDNAALGEYSGNGINVGSNNLFLGSWSGAYLGNISNYGVIQTGNAGSNSIATVVFDFANKRTGFNFLQGTSLSHTLEVNGDIRTGVAGTTQGKLLMEGSVSGVVTIKTDTTAGTYTLTLPTTDGNANEFLQTNGSGVLTWAAAGGTSITIGSTVISSGTNTRALFDDGGVVGEDAGFTYNKTSLTLSINSVSIGRGNTSTEATNTAIGNGAGNAWTSATNSTAAGYRALFVGTSGTNCTAFGYQALTANTTGDYNTAMGSGALQSNVSGSNNTAMGIQALLLNTVSSSTAVGYTALQVATTGGQNTAVGFQSLVNTTTGGTNTAMGYNAGQSNTSGSNNSYFGYAANGPTTGSNNTVVGAQVNIGAVSNTIAIGNGNGTIKFLDDATTTTLPDLVRMSAYGAGTATFDASGNITSVSDERLKFIQGNYGAGLPELMNIHPIIYKWRPESNMETAHSYAGFSAQNIKSVLGDLGSGINNAGYLSIQDRAIIAMLVNAVQQQQAEIDQLKKELLK